LWSAKISIEDSSRTGIYNAYKHVCDIEMRRDSTSEVEKMKKFAVFATLVGCLILVASQAYWVFGLLVAEW